jgi:hypothetical protein
VQKIVAKYYFLFAVTSLFAAVLLRLLMLLFNLKVGFGFLFYILCAVGIAFLAVSAFGRKDYPNAFDKTNSKGMNLSAYIASLGYILSLNLLLTSLGRLCYSTSFFAVFCFGRLVLRQLKL